eukprot:1726153-Heterocapsa_arctica.AAC.1
MERRQSIGLLQGLRGLLRRVLKPYTSYVHVCFEWPRNCFGWKLEIMNELRQMMPYEVRFDGCCYGLVDQYGELLQKPWRVISTLPEISMLRLLCRHDHRHAVTHGLGARMSAYYTPAFASAVGTMLLQRIKGTAEGWRPSTAGS